MKEELQKIASLVDQLESALGISKIAQDEPQPGEEGSLKDEEILKEKSLIIVMDNGKADAIQGIFMPMSMINLLDKSEKTGEPNLVIIERDGDLTREKIELAPITRMRLKMVRDQLTPDNG